MPDLAEALSAITYVLIKYFDDNERIWKKEEELEKRQLDLHRISIEPLKLIIINGHIAWCAFLSPVSTHRGESFDYFMNFFGKCFVKFFTNFGYDKMLKATGRYFCDFLQSVDNIHLQMRFTYPKMKSPSMQLTETDEHGAVLVYRSGRSGFSR